MPAHSQHWMTMTMTASVTLKSASPAPTPTTRRIIQVYCPASYENAAQMHLAFQTVSGKHYSVGHSTSLNQFNKIHPGWIGDNAVRNLEIAKDGTARSADPIYAQFWSDLSDPSTN